MKRYYHTIISLFGAMLLLLAIMACNISVPSQQRVENGLATAQAAGEQVSQFATSAAPTLVALQTQAVDFATRAAPTVEAGIEIAQTAVIDAQERAIQAKATLDAAGIDGRYLWQKVQTIVPDENGNVLISFTETELNLALNAHLLIKKQDGETPPLENMRIRFDDGLMFLEGRIESPVAADVSLRLHPTVQNGNLRLDIVSADANGYALPQFVTSSISAVLNQTVVDAVNGFPLPVTLQNIYIGSDSITFASVRA